MGDILQEALFYGYLVFVSLIFWFKDSNSLKFRLFVSAHGLLVLAVFGIAYLIFLTGIIKTWLLYFFFVLLLLPICSIVFSFIYFKGHKLFHVLHLITLLALFWVFFVGGMMVTHDFI